MGASCFLDESGRAVLGHVGSRHSCLPGEPYFHTQREHRLGRSTWDHISCSTQGLKRDGSEADSPCQLTILFFFFLTFYFILEYSRLTMLWYFQADSQGTQPYIYVYPLSSKLLSHPGCHITLSRVSCAIQFLKVLVHPFQVSSDCPHPKIHLWSSDCLVKEKHDYKCSNRTMRASLIAQLVKNLPASKFDLQPITVIKQGTLVNKVKGKI